jgi:hypothetical protein
VLLRYSQSFISYLFPIYNMNAVFYFALSIFLFFDLSDISCPFIIVYSISYIIGISYLLVHEIATHKNSISTILQAEPLDCALDLMRRMPPEKVEQNLANLIDIVPELTEDLLASVDQPLKIQQCKQSSKEYLLCDYNRDGDSYR